MDSPLPQILFDFSAPEPPREQPAAKPQPEAGKPRARRGRKPLKPTEAGPDKVLVPPDAELFQKQYWGIGEVAAMFGVAISQIRYWENNFPQLKPRKNGKGDRLFRPEDVKTLVLIHDLVRRRKYTLEGAKEYLEKGEKAAENFVLIQSLQQIKSFLLELKAHL